MAIATETIETSPIHITDAAAAKIKELMAKENAADHALRMRVVGGGCSGFQYQMGLEATAAATAKDKVYTDNGIKICIDEKSILYLTGVQIDYLNGLMESGFKVTNPNAQSTCGCGQSFR
jgi:iron-sulfur cluster assembly accessory protein